MKDADGSAVAFAILAMASMSFALMTITVIGAAWLLMTAPAWRLPAVASRQPAVVGSIAIATATLMPLPTAVAVIALATAAAPTLTPVATPAPTYAVHLPMVALAPNTPMAPAVVEAPATATSMPTVAPVAPTSTLEPPTATAMPTAAPTASVPDAGSGQAFVCTYGCATPPDPSCAIKGNVNSSGGRIYHAPGGRYYDGTDIKPEEGDVWFCTETEAINAGFRAPQQ